MYGSHDSSASVSRLRTDDRKLFVAEARGIDPHAFRIVEQQLLQIALRQREDVGNVEPIDWTGLHADRADQHQPAHGLRRLGGEFGGDPAADRAADHIDLIESQPVEQFEMDVGDVVDRIDPVGQAGLPEPGMRRRDQPMALGQRSDVGMLGREALRAVQEQNRRTFAGLEHLKLDAGYSNDLSLQGSPSSGLLVPP